MSLTSLATSFANTYVNAPALAIAGQDAHAAFTARQGAAGNAAAMTGNAPPLPANTTDPSATIGAALKALTEYIPSEVLTLYIAAVAVTEKWTFVPKEAAIDIQIHYLRVFFLVCLVLCPIWVFIGVLLTTRSAITWKALVWPMLAAPIAFFVYAYAVPQSWLAQTWPNGQLNATLLMLFITPILHVGTLVYMKIFPPPSP